MPLPVQQVAPSTRHKTRLRCSHGAARISPDDAPAEPSRFTGRDRQGRQDSRSRNGPRVTACNASGTGCGASLASHAGMARASAASSVAAHGGLMPSVPAASADREQPVRIRVCDDSGKSQATLRVSVGRLTPSACIVRPRIRQSHGSPRQPPPASRQGPACGCSTHTPEGAGVHRHPMPSKSTGNGYLAGVRAHIRWSLLA